MLIERDADMKRIVVFFEQPGAWGYPFNKPEYFNSHCQLSRRIGALGGTYVIARDQQTYQGSGRFSQSWQIRNGDLIETGPVQSDVIYDKGDIQAGGFRPVFNGPDVTLLCRNKWQSHMLLEDLSPESYLAQNRSELEDALASLDGELKVIKPVDGYEGIGVHIATGSKLLEADVTYPVIVQTFLDTSAGIAGIVDGPHDFRITYLNGKPVVALVRTPPPGGLMAGVAFGGELFVVDMEKVPAAFLDVAQEVDNRMKRYGPRFFTVDMALSPLGVKIIEINSRVGLQEDARHPAFGTLKEELAQALMAL